MVEAAAYLRVSVPTIGRLLRRGRLPGNRLGTSWRILRKDLEEYLHGNFGGPVSARSFPKARPRRSRTTTPEAAETAAKEAPSQAAP